ncbi:flagellar transcriptional regulator FlhD [Thiohalocapsa marina]|uniref:Flagellar transcriptional regulator FlhD n=1 Tax=Thiohalocapsa marina TaxID=424902 RepID=A0A5M8FH80_9GAMM|nr:flagellar transcriptional regulator FlhD [Thiohalocapsa marina]KAA6184238.1 flagellar transcriptional regulator FlhD [Thiohalocapsa marina]
MVRTSPPVTPAASSPLEGALDLDITHLNLQWLVGARALARNDVDQATLVYGLERELAEALREAPFTVLRTLAASGVLLVRPRFETRFLHERLAASQQATTAFELQSILLAAEGLTQP